MRKELDGNTEKVRRELTDAGVVEIEVIGRGGPALRNAERQNDFSGDGRMTRFNQLHGHRRTSLDAIAGDRCTSTGTRSGDQAKIRKHFDSEDLIVISKKLVSDVYGFELRARAARPRDSHLDAQRQSGTS